MWCYMTSSDAMWSLWCHLSSWCCELVMPCWLCDAMWSHVMSLELMMSCDLVMSHDLMWCHVTSCRVLPTLVSSGNARPVVCYPDQYLPSPTSTNTTQLAALHYRWVWCALYRVSQWGIFFAHAHVWKYLVCTCGSESGGWCPSWTTSHEPTRLVTTVSRHQSECILWTMPGSSQSPERVHTRQCRRSWQWPPLRKC